MIAFTYPPTNLAHLVVVLMATFPEFSISSALEHPALPNPEISIALVAILIRWTVASWPYSGMNSPPMYGDFEAQRHWMEITNGIPVAQWYKDTDGNDLSYWGLDYPPLTAFHSWICGKM